PGDLRPEMQSDPFVRLDVYLDPVGFEMADRGLAEKREGGLLKLDNDGRVLRRHSLAGPQVERHPGPPPVVDRKFQSGKRLGPGIFRDLFFFAISLRRFAVELARAVLSAHGASAGL